MPEKPITAEQRKAIMHWIEEKDSQGKPRGWYAGWQGGDQKTADRYVIGHEDNGDYLKLWEDRTGMPAWDGSHPRQNERGIFSVSCSDEIAKQLEETGLVQFPNSEATPVEH